MSIRVLFVINGLGTGGAERSLAEMLPELAHHDVDASVVHLYDREQGVHADVRRGGTPLLPLTASTLPARVRQLRRHLRERRPDLVHVTLFEAALVTRLASRGITPVVESLVNTSYDPVRRADPSVRRATLAAMRHVDGWTARRFVLHFHAITPTVKEHAVGTLGIPADRITVIERGRDPARLGDPSADRRRRARAALALGDDDEVVVNVGRQEFQKGQRVLIEAVARLAAHRPRLVVLVAGRTGAASRELAELVAAHHLGARVRFLGHRNDVPEVLAAADVFAFPSLYEGLGGAVLEAMALGLPIVASDLPALRDVVEAGRSAVLVPPGDPEALAAAVDRVFTDPESAARAGGRGRELFLERFTVAASTERMVELYERLVASPGKVSVW